MEKTFEFPQPQTAEENVEGSEGRVQNRAAEHTVAVSRPQVIEKIGDVMPTTENIDCVDVPMPPGAMRTSLCLRPSQRLTK